jgi:hypothetical protein
MKCPRCGLEHPRTEDCPRKAAWLNLAASCFARPRTSDATLRQSLDLSGAPFFSVATALANPTAADFTLGSPAASRASVSGAVPGPL